MHGSKDPWTFYPTLERYYLFFVAPLSPGCLFRLVGILYRGVSRSNTIRYRKYRRRLLSAIYLGFLLVFYIYPQLLINSQHNNMVGNVAVISVRDLGKHGFSLLFIRLKSNSGMNMLLLSCQALYLILQLINGYSTITAYACNSNQRKQYSVRNDSRLV
jgi:hypothetical protein